MALHPDWESMPCPLPEVEAEGHLTSPGSPEQCGEHSESLSLFCDPTSPGSPEQCGEHSESLSLFCVDDLEPVCRQCAATGSHVGHRVYPMAEALGDCKGELRMSLDGLQNRLIHLESVTKTCGHALTHNLVQGQQTETQIKEEFKKLHQFLREEEGGRLGALWEEEEARKSEVEEKLDSFLVGHVIQSLEERIQQIEEEMEAGGEEFLQNFKDTMKRVWQRHTVPDRACGTVIDVSKHLGNLRFNVWDKMKHIAPYTPLTLDPRTAHQSLRVSPGLVAVQMDPSLGVSVPMPDTPERFHPHSCVLARHGYNSGTHCWEIEVGDSSSWTVGVAGHSLCRKEAFEACPESGLWAISLREGEYRALTTPYQLFHPDKSRLLSRVRVRLDWDQGQLEFCDADSGGHLFSFTHNFAEKVYPYFESASPDRELVVLPQEVKVNVGLEHVPSEAPAITGKLQVARNRSFNKGEVSAVNGTTTTSNGNLSENGWPGNNHTSSTTSTADQPPERKTTCAVMQIQSREKGEKLDSKMPISNKDQVSISKTSGGPNNTNPKPQGKKNSSKKRFSVNYHVSLNRALKEASPDKD